MSFNYNFPACTGWIPSNDFERYQQHVKMNEEVEEVERAISESDTLYIIEVLDVIHAAETALREFPDERVQHLAIEVEQKNRERGYYE